MNRHVCLVLRHSCLVLRYFYFVAPFSGPTRLTDSNRFRDARLILFVYFSFVCCCFFCTSVATRIPGPTQRTDPNRSPVYFDRFPLSYQNILFMSFHFRVFNYVEAFSNGMPINIYSYRIRLQNGVSCLYQMIYKTIVQSLTLLFTKCHTFKRNGMHMAGYIFIRHNFLYDSTLLDLTFFLVYSKLEHR